MNLDNKENIYVSPISKEKLNIKKQKIKNNQVIEGYFFDEANNKYYIQNGVPSFLDDSDKNSQTWSDYYNKNADTYDDFNHLTFSIHGFDEIEVRSSVIKQLDLKPNGKVLEIGCGTGRDSEIIANILNEEGELWMLDVSYKMLMKCIPKLEKFDCLTEFLLANSSSLPFPDNYFDACYSFVTLAAIPDKKKAIFEMARVTKTNGKIVIGNEGLIPSLKQTEFGKIIINNCDIYGSNPPLDILPDNINNLKLSWILNGIIHVIEFTVSDPVELEESLTYLIPSKRGGSLKTRFYGKLEGVTKETKQLATEAMLKSNLSKHEWLSKIIIESALKQLENEI